MKEIGDDKYYPTLFENPADLINATANGSCSYMLGDGGYLLRAVNGKNCGRLVRTGKEFRTRGLTTAIPRNWIYKQDLSKAFLELNENIRLPSFQEYTSRLHTCDSQRPPQVDFYRLRLFFFLAFGVCAALFVEMLLAPQTPFEEHPSATSGRSQNDDLHENEDVYVA